LDDLGGRLVIFGPITPAAARSSGLDAPNIELEGLLPSERLINVLRQRADALFVPMSFDTADRNNMEVGFPSKLTDYTSVGVPLMVFGPSYCSAVRWAIENDGVAEVVTSESGSALAEALRRLTCDPGHRIALGRKALEVGEAYFSHRVVSEVLSSALLGTKRVSDMPRAVEQ
jgi:glycosyltransferase involved in cell wall biosynthesis